MKEKTCPDCGIRPKAVELGVGVCRECHNRRQRPHNQKRGDAYREYMRRYMKNYRLRRETGEGGVYRKSESCVYCENAPMVGRALCETHYKEYQKSYYQTVLKEKRAVRRLRMQQG